jgi:hypothetical protein
MGVSRVMGRVLHIRSRIVRELRDLGDRSDPPFDAFDTDEDFWFDPTASIERTSPMGPKSALWSGVRSTLSGTDSLQPAPVALHGLASWERSFNPWAVVADWLARGDAVVEGRCAFRGLPRLTLRRLSGPRAEHLLVSESDGLPVALRRTEPSYFKGPESVEYRYGDWDRVGSALFPMGVMRVVGGAKDRLRIVGASGATLVSRDSAPPFPAMAAFGMMPDSLLVPPEPYWTDAPPDTVRVGTHAFLLVNRSFTSAIALVADTVFILDSPQGDRRARQDSSWIGKLFPGRHPLVFVAATDIWPHIAGLRYWVANGATVVTHPLTAPMIRATTHARIETVRSRESRAGGALTIFPINGAASEGVLGAYIADAGFLWASDRVQDTTSPNLYISELVQTTDELHLTPRVTSGPHFRLVPWAALVAQCAPVALRP